MGLEPTTFTLATCARWVLSRERRKGYGAGGITLHYSFADDGLDVGTSERPEATEDPTAA